MALRYPDRIRTTLLGPKLGYEKKLVYLEPPLILMNSMHQQVKMAENNCLLPRGIEGQTKKLFHL